MSVIQHLTNVLWWNLRMTTHRGSEEQGRGSEEQGRGSEEQGRGSEEQGRASLFSHHGCKFRLQQQKKLWNPTSAAAWERTGGVFLRTQSSSTHHCSLLCTRFKYPTRVVALSVKESPTTIWATCIYSSVKVQVTSTWEIRIFPPLYLSMSFSSW